MPWCHLTESIDNETTSSRALVSRMEKSFCYPQPNQPSFQPVFELLVSDLLLYILRGK